MICHAALIALSLLCFANRGIRTLREETARRYGRSDSRSAGAPGGRRAPHRRYDNGADDHHHYFRTGRSTVTMVTMDKVCLHSVHKMR